MDRKTLEELGIEKEAIDKILDSWHETLKPIKEKADKADSLTERVGALEADVKKKDESIKKLSGEDNPEELKKQIEAMKTNSEKAKKDYDNKVADLNAKLDTSAFDSMLDKALSATKSRDNIAVKAHLDMDALKGSKNREADIKEAIEALTKGEKTSYLFEATPESTVNIIGGVKGGGNKEKAAEASARAVMGLTPKKSE